MMASFTIGELMMSSTSCVTTTASPKYFLTVLKRYLIYSLILADIRAFQHSSISIILRIPLSLRILAMKVSIMISVTTGRSTLLLLILSSSNTMNRLPVRSSSLSEFSRKS